MPSLPKPPPKPPNLIDFWYAALASRVDISITTDPEDRKLLREQLYRERAAQGDVELEQIAVTMPAIEGEVWLTRKGEIPDA